MITLGFTTYRPEALTLEKPEKLKHDLVVLEEPQTPGFEEMLNNQLSIADYLQLTDFAFAEYSQRSCRIMRELNAKGVKFQQIDPFMDELVRIHEFFASEGTPEQIQQEPTLSVYRAERKWTARLLAFYDSSLKEEFGQVVRAVQAFARADAERGALRDKMRAREIIKDHPEDEDLYVEAGYIHLSLLQEFLRHKIKPRIFYVLEPIYRKLCSRRQALAPGDRLTWLYLNHPQYIGSYADLLAAQALIYNKIISKDELPTPANSFPHAQDEVECIGLVEDLAFSSCQNLFKQIRSLSTNKAKEKLKQILEQ
jgi:hypothetical protein